MGCRSVVLVTSYDMTLFMWFRPFRNVFKANILKFDQNPFGEDVNSARFGPFHQCVEVDALV